MTIQEKLVGTIVEFNEPEAIGTLMPLENTSQDTRAIDLNGIDSQDPETLETSQPCFAKEQSGNTKASALTLLVIGAAAAGAYVGISAFAKKPVTARQEKVNNRRAANAARQVADEARLKSERERKAARAAESAESDRRARAAENRKYELDLAAAADAFRKQRQRREDAAAAKANARLKRWI